MQDPESGQAKTCASVQLEAALNKSLGSPGGQPVEHELSECHVMKRVNRGSY